MNNLEHLIVVILIIQPLIAFFGNRIRSFIKFLFPILY